MTSDASDATTASDVSDSSAPDVENASDGAEASNANGIPPGLLDYANNYATAFCTGMAKCCGVDAGGFDMTACEADWSQSGWELQLPSDNGAYTQGNLTFDSTKAAACIAALQAWPCGTFGSAENQAIASACAGVLGGTIPIGGMGCLSSFECVSGAWCNGGTCTALLASGGSCTADEQCSYAATNQPGLFCDLYPAGGASPTIGACRAALPNAGTSLCGNANGYDDSACTSRSCGDDNVCGDMKTNPATDICPGYLIGGG